MKYRKSVFVSKLKSFIAKIVCNNIIGKLINYVYSSKISYHNYLITVNNKVSYSTVASIYFGLYEKSEYRLISKYYRGSKDTIEIGSSIGGISSLLIDKIDQQKRLICVEGNKNIIGLLKSNIENNNTRNNKVEKKYSIVNKCIGDYEILKNYNFVDKTNTQVSKLTKRSKTNCPSIQKSNVISLANLTKTNQIENYILICDIEGAEVFFLEDTNSLDQCVELFIELHKTERLNKEYSIYNLRELIVNKHGFSMVDSDGDAYYFRKK
jgi:FkbM family methyltransferase